MLEAASLEDVTTPRRTGDRRFALEVPDGWQQGRGAFGGLVLGAAVRAVEGFAGQPDRPLRTLTAELCGPLLPGPAEILVEPLRLGTGTSTVAARVIQGDELAAHAVLVLGRHRTDDGAGIGMARPPMPDWRGQAAAVSRSQPARRTANRRS